MTIYDEFDLEENLDEEDDEDEDEDLYLDPDDEGEYINPLTPEEILAREKALRLGHRRRLKDKLLTINTDNYLVSDIEVLESLLFYSIPRKDVKTLSKILIRDFASLAGVVNATPENLLRYKHVSYNTIALFRVMKLACVRLLKQEINSMSCLDSFNKIVDYCYLDLSYQYIEKIKVIYLNNRNVIIEDETVHEGDINNAILYPRNVLKKALDNGAAHVVVVHNHPSGNPTPSKEDIEATMKLQTALQSVDIHLTDHVIIGKNGVSSMRKLGLI